MKVCHTVNAWTLHNGKVLLVKHKKLGIWLAPGGHVEANELPHMAAQREFWEESGVRGQVISAYKSPKAGKTSQYLPLPFYCNLHEINKPRGNTFCEQHYSWGFFVRVTDQSGFAQNLEETDGIGWFGPDEIDDLETSEDIKNEARFVFQNFPN
ncbi:MAG TPA: NUDIX domain-containing protein [Patescibacteria group bacterium]|nr:NUDIX domain-containing protein [Patescibacteria group bacterium]